MVQKKSLTVPELVKEIKKFKAGMTATAIMSALRKKFTFSKDKWNLARKSLEKSAVASSPAESAKIPAKSNHTDQKDSSKCATSLFYDAIDAVDEVAEGMVSDIFYTCKEHPDSVAFVDVCPLKHPSVFAMLNKAVEAGLLSEIHGYVLGDAFVKHSKSCKKPKPKKK